MSNQKDIEMFGENSIFVKQNKALDIIQENNENLLKKIKNEGPPQKSEQVLACENPFNQFFQSLDEKIDCSRTINAFEREVAFYNGNIRILEESNKDIDKLKLSGTIEEKDFIIANQKLEGVIDNHVRSSDVASVGNAMTNLIDRINNSEKAEKEMTEIARNNAEIVIHKYK